MPKETREVWAKRVERWKDSALTGGVRSRDRDQRAIAVVVAMASREGIEGVEAAETSTAQAPAEASWC